MIQIPIAPEAFAAKASTLAAEHGITLTGTEGKLTKSGVTAGYAYKDGILTVEILEKPFFVSTEYCEDQLKKFLGV